MSVRVRQGMESIPYRHLAPPPSSAGCPCGRRSSRRRLVVLIILIVTILAPSFPPTLLARTEITESYCTKVGSVSHAHFPFSFGSHSHRYYSRVFSSAEAPSALPSLLGRDQPPRLQHRQTPKPTSPRGFDPKSQNIMAKKESEKNAMRTDLSEPPSAYGWGAPS